MIHRLHDPPLPRILLMAEYRAWPLWDRESGENLSPDDLPLRAATRARLHCWTDAHARRPPRSGGADGRPPDAATPDAFEREGISLWHTLREELASRYTVSYFSEQVRRRINNPAELG